MTFMHQSDFDINPHEVPCTLSAYEMFGPPVGTGHPQTYSVGDRVGLTIFRNAESRPLAKIADVGIDGRLILHTAANMTEGTSETLFINGLRDLYQAMLQKQYGPDCAIAPGCATDPVNRIASKKAIAQGHAPGAIARTPENFPYREGAPGVIPFDFDLPEGVWWSIDELDALMCTSVPWWARTQRFYMSSASAGIYQHARHVSTKRHYHGYMIADNAAAIPGIIDAVFQAVFERGWGKVVASKSGQALLRTLIDRAVRQANRLDFAFGAYLTPGKGLTQHPEHKFFEGTPMLATADKEAAVSFSRWRGESVAVRQAKTNAAPEINAARDAWLKARIAEGEQRGMTRDHAARVYTNAVTRAWLDPDFELIHESGAVVRVRDLLASPKQWHEARFYDPLEPDYREDERIAVALLDNGRRPIVYSHAHGGMSYLLMTRDAEIIDAPGERDATLETVIEHMRSQPDLFRRGAAQKEFVQIDDDGIIHTMDDAWLAANLDRHFHFAVWKQEGRGEQKTAVKVQVPAPAWLPPRISSVKTFDGFRNLKSVVTAPFIRHTGEVVQTPGYDPHTGILLFKQADEAWPWVAQFPTVQDALAALRVLMKPISLFPYETPNDRAVALAAMLTAVARDDLETAPGFYFDAPQASSGKSLLARTLAAIRGGFPGTLTQSRDPEELRKRLLALLRQGQQTILLDNLSGVFQSEVFDGFITAPNFSDRVLGCTAVATYPTNVLFLMTGNNMSLGGDTWRRVLTCRLNAKMADPEKRSFPFHPVRYVERNRPALVAAALTILRACVCAGSPAGRSWKVGSFEDWDKLVARAAEWVIKLSGDDAFGDPLACIAEQKQQAPEVTRLDEVLDAIQVVFGNEPWTVADLVAKAGTDARFPTSLMSVLRSLPRCLKGHDLDRQALGQWLSAQRDRCHSTKHIALKRCGDYQGSACWSVSA